MESQIFFTGTNRGTLVLNLDLNQTSVEDLLYLIESRGMGACPFVWLSWNGKPLRFLDQKLIDYGIIPESTIQMNIKVIKQLNLKWEGKWLRSTSRPDTNYHDFIAQLKYDNPDVGYENFTGNDLKKAIDRTLKLDPRSIIVRSSTLKEDQIVWFCDSVKLIDVIPEDLCSLGILIEFKEESAPDKEDLKKRKPVNSGKMKMELFSNFDLNSL